MRSKKVFDLENEGQGQTSESYRLILKVDDSDLAESWQANFFCSHAYVRANK